jgi:hypothetical protein
MAKVSSGTYTASRRKRKGVHAKSSSSQQKQSKNYLKKYRGQGR